MTHTPVKILFLPKYSSKAPSSRYRTFQYINDFKKSGLIVNVKPLFNDEYITDLFSNKRKNILNIFMCYIKRVYYLLTAAQYDLLYIEKEALPYIPFWLENILLPRKYILDYDDAVFENYLNSKNGIVKYLFGDKISKLMRNAKTVVTGSPYLTNYAKIYNDVVVEIPTSINWERYKVLPNVQKQPDEFVIGWIGSPSSSKYILKIIEPLKQFIDLHTNVKLHLIGFDNKIKINLKEENIDILKWSDELEVEMICNFDIGIMPLNNDPFSRGKCGFKLIQYMACGLPTISTPLEANISINEGSNNLFADNDNEWFKAFETAYNNKNHYKTVGDVNRQLAYKKFSLQSNLAIYISLFESLKNA